MSFSGGFIFLSLYLYDPCQKLKDDLDTLSWPIPRKGKGTSLPFRLEGPSGVIESSFSKAQDLFAILFQSKWWASPLPAPDLSATALHSQVQGEQGKLSNVRKTSHKGIISFSNPSREANCVPLSSICRSD